MASEVFEDVLELEIDLIEAIFPTLDRPILGYPMPELRRTGARDVRPFRSVILENEFLRISLLPELGGRIWSVHDKRQNLELLPNTGRIAVAEGGIRGAFCDQGIQVVLDGVDRSNAMGQVLFQVLPADDGESSSGVRFADFLTGGTLSLDWTVGLAHDAATIEFEVRIQNRSLDVGCGCLAGLRVGGRHVAANVMEVEGRSLFALSSKEYALPFSADGAWLRSAASFELGPRQVDTFRFCVTPYASIGDFTAANEHVACCLGPTRLVVQSSARRRSQTILILTSSGQTMEAAADLHPERPLDMALEGAVAGAQGVAVLDADRAVILNTQSAPAQSVEGEPVAGCAILRVSAVEDLWLSTRRAEMRAQAYLRLAIHSIQSAELADADRLLELSLLYNGDDSLVWWLKSVVCRLKGDQQNERPELLNAHFLAPLEPALRAEGFLSQPHDGNADPHPILTPLDAQPELFVEVACLLIESCLWEQAARFLDEALRHEKLAMLHLLMSYCLLVGSRMDMEAAQHAFAAGQLADQPPFPFRTIERVALSTVNERFSIPQLIELEQIVDAHLQQTS